MRRIPFALVAQFKNRALDMGFIGYDLRRSQGEEVPTKTVGAPGGSLGARGALTFLRVVERVDEAAIVEPANEARFDDLVDFDAGDLGIHLRHQLLNIAQRLG